MLSLDELWKLEANTEVAKEAFTQGEKRLADILDTKKVIEQKATSLFSAYVTLALAISGVGAAIFKDPLRSETAIAFVLPVGLFATGAGFFMRALKSADYGTLGSSPAHWLRPGVIDAAKGVEPARTLAQLAYNFEQKINDGIAANDKKYAAIHTGMLMGLIGVAAFAASLLCAFAATA